MSECKIFDNKKFAEMNCVGGKKLSAKEKLQKGKFAKFLLQNPKGLTLQKRNGGTKFAAIFLFLSSQVLV